MEERTIDTNNKIYIVIDPDTGDIVGEYPKDGMVKHISQEQLDYLEKYKTGFNKNESFVKVYKNSLSMMKQVLSNKEIGASLLITEYVSYSTCILMRNGKPLDIKSLCEIIGEKYETGRRIFSTLMEHEIIKKVDYTESNYLSLKKKCIIVNPYVYFIGTNIERSVIKHFYNSMWNTKKNNRK